MLKKLILENWKSFRYAELPIDPLTILIGVNASGKSNAIEALAFLHLFSQGDLLAEILQGISSSVRVVTNRKNHEGQLQPFTIRAVISGEEEDALVDYEYSISAIASFPFLVGAETFSKLDLSSGTRQRTAVFDSSKLDDLLCFENSFAIKEVLQKHNEHLSPLGLSWLDALSVLFVDQQLSEVAAHLLDSLRKIYVFSPQPSKMRSYSALNRYLESDASNIAGFLAAMPDSTKHVVEAELSRYLQLFLSPDICKIWSERVGRQSTDAMLYGEEVWGNGDSLEVDARSMSDGTLRFVAILTALLTNEEGSQLIVEDIDDGLHPSRAKLLLQAIREIGEQRKIDVLVTTHNPALLDSLEQDFLPFVVVAHRDSHTGESLLTPLDKIENLPKLLASASLGDLATQGALERNLETEAIAP